MKGREEKRTPREIITGDLVSAALEYETAVEVLRKEQTDLAATRAKRWHCPVDVAYARSLVAGARAAVRVAEYRILQSAAMYRDVTETDK